jgi:hypothetical protein
VYTATGERSLKLIAAEAGVQRGSGSLADGGLVDDGRRVRYSRGKRQGKRQSKGRGPCLRLSSMPPSPEKSRTPELTVSEHNRLTVDLRCPNRSRCTAHNIRSDAIRHSLRRRPTVPLSRPTLFLPTLPHLRVCAGYGTYSSDSSVLLRTRGKSLDFTRQILLIRLSGHMRSWSDCTILMGCTRFSHPDSPVSWKLSMSKSD